MKDDTVYLHHIMECIRRIEEDVSEGRERFLRSHTLQDAVIRNLQTMAESAQRASDNLKRSHPEIEWHRIAAFRDVPWCLMIVEELGGLKKSLAESNVAFLLFG